MALNIGQGGSDTSAYSLEESARNNELHLVLKQYYKLDLLIIDDFLLSPVSHQQQQYLMELIEYRSRKKATIYTSQMNEEIWHSRLGGVAIADAILDRISSQTYRFTMKGDSYRKKQK
ncbi:MAG: ATP-binding protein [Culicoidibacterales bacterium]